MIIEYANTLKESTTFEVLLLKELAVVKNPLLNSDIDLLEELANTISKYSEVLLKESKQNKYQLALVSDGYLTENNEITFFWENNDHVMFNEKNFCVYNDDLKEFHFFQIEDKALLSEGERLDRFKSKVKSSWDNASNKAKSAVIGATMLGAGMGVNYAMDSYNPQDVNSQKQVQTVKSPKQIESEYKQRLNQAFVEIEKGIEQNGGSISKRDFKNIEAELKDLLYEFNSDRNVKNLPAKISDPIYQNLKSKIDIKLKTYENNISFTSKVGSFFTD